ncbi:MAG: hypothetical protein IMZ55_14525 [Acidobacteria bacterium]|nr:hypothetical protein [Planctomycetota bacterium]MBE3134682.1 hypothetical protein [Acidobacteriota bacterium]
MRLKKIGFLMAAGVAILAGCQQTAHTDLTFQRGVQLLAAGSPQSAIPFLTQVIASAPDGPEPHAILALAYALDLQSDRAIAQAGQVRRAKGEAPGWELVALGIAEMAKRRDSEATRHLDLLVRNIPQGCPMGLAARQWLALSLLLQGHDAKALESAETLTHTGPARTTALLWTALIHAQCDRSSQAAEALAGAAKEIAVLEPRKPPLPNGDAEEDGQDLYDAAVAALAKGELEKATGFFNSVAQRNPNASDAPVWLSLIAAANGDWPSGRSKLKAACGIGSLRSRGLASHLFSVVCAIERRPEAMIQSIVVGQRLLGRSNLPAHVVAQPKADVVWFSERME